MHEIKYKMFKLEELFDAQNGNSKLTKTYCNMHSGPYEVFSGATKDHFAFIDTFEYDTRNLSFSTDGEYAGTLQILEGKYSVGSHRTILVAKNDKIDINYFKYILANVIKSKYKKGDVPSVHWKDIKKELVCVPINDDEDIDINMQKKISNKYLKIEKNKKILLEKEKFIKNINVSLLNNYQITYCKINELFKPTLGSGKYTKTECVKNRGNYPVYSGNTNGVFAKINVYNYDGEYLTWAKDGLAGYLMYHNEKFSITNHRGILIPTEKCKNIDLQYIKLVLEPILRRNIKGRLGLEGKNEYTTLSKDMINKIQEMIPIPIKENGEFDIDKQKEISNKILKINKIKEKILKEIDRLIKIEIKLI